MIKPTSILKKNDCVDIMIQLYKCGVVQAGEVSWIKSKNIPYRTKI